MPAYRPALRDPAAPARSLPRRTFLKAAGVSMSLPWLSAMAGASDDLTIPSDVNYEAPGGPPRRFVAMTLGLGLVAENLYPKEAGRGWTPSKYLKPLEDLRDRMTLISGTSHPGVTGGHRAEAAILTCNPAGSSGTSRNSVSLDQFMAKQAGGQTRFPSLVVASSGSSSPCYTESGAMIPAEDRPSRLFTKLFIDDSPAERKRQAGRVRSGRSVMDLVAADAKRLSKEVAPGDRRRLDEYFTSVRELEMAMAESEEWAKMPKPKVDAKKPVDIRNAADFVGRQKLMTGVLKLALETDSTRFITYHLGSSGGVVPLEGVEEGYHGLSHHGLNEDKLDQLAIVEGAIISAWGDFLRGLSEVKESGRSLLDSTNVLLTSNLGNASNHSNKNMPVLFAGGGFRHGKHLAFDPKDNAPLPNLYLSVLRDMGFAVDGFATSTGTLGGLDAA